MWCPDLLDLRIQLIGDCSLEALLRSALIALEGTPLLRPTHWGISAGIRDPYDSEALLEVARTRSDAAPSLLRTKSPGMYASVSYSYSGGGKGASIELDTREQVNSEDAAVFCDAISSVAGTVPVEFGSIDILFKDQDKSTRMHRGGSGHHLPTYLRNGPDILFARNYFGARLIHLMGGERVLVNSGFPVTRLANGAMQLDLISEPWTSDPATLKRAQTRAYGILLGTGVLAHPSPDGKLVPGPRWEPTRAR